MSMRGLYTRQLASHMYHKMGEIATGINDLKIPTKKITELLELVVDMQIFIDRLFNMYNRGERE